MDREVSDEVLAIIASVLLVGFVGVLLVLAYEPPVKSAREVAEKVAEEDRMDAREVAESIALCRKRVLDRLGHTVRFSSIRQKPVAGERTGIEGRATYQNRYGGEDRTSFSCLVEDGTAYVMYF